MAELLLTHGRSPHDLAAHGSITRSADLADLTSQARQALSRSRIYDLRRLHVDQDGEAVVLRGRVSSFYHKQLAQEVVRNAIDGVEVINAIRVIYSAERAW
jgi:osmotically-inducible protein OsmY